MNETKTGVNQKFPQSSTKNETYLSNRQQTQCNENRKRPNPNSKGNGSKARGLAPSEKETSLLPNSVGKENQSAIYCHQAAALVRVVSKRYWDAEAGRSWCYSQRGDC